MEPAVLSKVRAGKIWKAGLLAAVLATVVNVIIYVIERDAFGILLEIPPGPLEFRLPRPITVWNVVTATVFPAIVATALFWFLAKFTKKPRKIFVLLALVALLLSFIAPFSIPGPLSTKIGLAVMHVAAAVVILSLLTRRSKMQ